MSRAPHRFYFAGHLKGEGPVVELSEDESRHLLRVLRLRAGTTVDLFDASGQGWSGQVEAGAGSRARVRLLGPIERDLTLGPPLGIAIALVKRRAMDLVIEKLSELGVDTVQPLMADRTVTRLDENDPPERWGRLAIAAAKQCGRNQPLAILPPAPVLDWLQRDRPPAHTIFADPSPAARPIGQWLAERSGARLPMWVAIGPEGGWTPRECAAFEQAGFLPVRLMNMILRTETAAMAAATACRLLSDVAHPSAGELL